MSISGSALYGLRKGRKTQTTPKQRKQALENSSQRRAAANTKGKITGKGGKTVGNKANVTREQLKASGHKSLTSYMNAWNKSGKRPGAAIPYKGATTKAPDTKNKTSAKTTKKSPAKPMAKKSKPFSVGDYAADGMRKRTGSKVVTPSERARYKANTGAFNNKNGAVAKRNLKRAALGGATLAAGAASVPTLAVRGGAGAVAAAAKSKAGRAAIAAGAKKGRSLVNKGKAALDRARGKTPYKGRKASATSAPKPGRGPRVVPKAKAGSSANKPVNHASKMPKSSKKPTAKKPTAKKPAAKKKTTRKKKENPS